jgi:hypothetical protein
VENIQTVLTQLNRRFLGGAKIPHGMSNPVLRKHGDRYAIAVFFYTYKKEHLDAKQLPRPRYWMLADIDSGAPIAENDCREADFSGQALDALYSSANPDAKKPAPDFFDDLFALFDAVRASALESGAPDKEKYAAYLNAMLALVPPAYRIFYRELSEEAKA